MTIQILRAAAVRLLVGALGALLLVGGLASSAMGDTAGVTWYDGTIAPKPAGALLTGNPGYWGAMVHTDVSYTYPAQPTNPPDVPGENRSGFGNRLLDGLHRGNWNVPVGMNYKPLVVDFDFHQEIQLNEIATSEFRDQMVKQADVWVKARVGDPWKQVYALKDPVPGKLVRIVLPEAVQARYVRLVVQTTGSTTYLTEVWMWGNAKAVPVKSEDGFLPGMDKYPGAKPGDATILSVAAMKAWRARTGYETRGLTWQVANPWRMLDKDPFTGDFLPDRAALEQTVRLKVTRSEGESAALYLVNASDQTRELTVNLSDFKDSQGQVAKGLTGRLYVGGTLWTHAWGQTVRPLFSVDNKLPPMLMREYLTNGSAIADFPTLHLPPRGTAFLWITIHTRNAPPGEYVAQLSDGMRKIPVRVKVLPVTLPRPDDWVRFWGNSPVSQRNLWMDPGAMQREMAYQIDMGVSVFDGWPDEYPYIATAMKLLKEQDRRGYLVIGMPSDIRDQGYTGKLDPSKFDDAFREKVRQIVLERVAHAKRLGLPYDQWSIELWDEPNPSNMAAWVGVAKIIRQTDPKVRIYMNPLFWTQEGNNPPGFTSDARQVASLSGWYNKLVDISVPLLGQVNRKAYPQANALFYNYWPRFVRAYYIHPCPGRMLTWEAMERNYNGWGFYAYYVPHGNAWNDFDSAPFDYQIVYPGPAGFVPTVQSESMRESWDDVGLMTLLKAQGHMHTYHAMLQGYESGVIGLPENETPADRDRRTRRAIKILPTLRDRMLRQVGGS